MDKRNFSLNFPLADKAVAKKQISNQKTTTGKLSTDLWDLYELQRSLVRIKSTFHKLVLKYLRKSNVTEFLNLKDLASVF